MTDIGKKIKIIGKDGKEYLRMPCEVYTRVMGYLRPVSHYNKGKKSEFYSRKNFVIEDKDVLAFNRIFNQKWEKKIAITEE